MKNMSTSQVNNNQASQDSSPNPNRWVITEGLMLTKL
jgi:hypothetical protein